MPGAPRKYRSVVDRNARFVPLSATSCRELASRVAGLVEALKNGFVLGSYVSENAIGAFRLPVVGFVVRVVVDLLCFESNR